MSEYHDRLRAKLSAELGPEVRAALNDPTVVEIMLNPSGELWVERHGAKMERLGSMTPANSLSLLGTVASSLSATITRDNPIVEGELILDGSRFEGLIPPVVEAPVFAIRRRASAVFLLASYVETGVITPAEHEALRRHIAARHNILVVGGTGTGKTTLVNALIGEVVEQEPLARSLSDLAIQVKWRSRW